MCCISSASHLLNSFRICFACHLRSLSLLSPRSPFLPPSNISAGYAQTLPPPLPLSILLDHTDVPTSTAADEAAKTPDHVEKADNVRFHVCMVCRRGSAVSARNRAHSALHRFTLPCFTPIGERTQRTKARRRVAETRRCG